LENFRYDATAMFREDGGGGARRNVTMARTGKGYSFAPRRR